MDKKFRKRLITLLLSLALIITYMPTSFLTYAVDNDPAVTTEGSTDAGDGSTEVNATGEPQTVNVDEPESTGPADALPGGDDVRNGDVPEVRAEGAKGGTDSNGDESAEVADNYHVSWTFRWSNGGGSASGGYEYKNPKTGVADPTYLFYHPQSWNWQNANLLLELTFSGEEDQCVRAGAIEIRIPLSVFKGWDGVRADEIVTQVPKAPETNAQSNFNYTIDEDKQEIVLHNFNDITGNDYLSVEFSYKVSPLDIAGGQPDEEAARAAGYTDPDPSVVTNATAGSNDIDRFCWNHNGEYLWKDYYKNEGLNCSIMIDSNLDGTADFYDYDNPLSVAMMTRAGGYLRIRPMADTKNGVYTAWQSTWGAEPEDADDYVYVIWNANYGTLTNSSVNQPYGIDMFYDANYPAITFGEGENAKTIYGEQVGKMLHTTTFMGGTPNNSTNNLYNILTNWGGDSSRGYYPNLGTDSTNTTYKNNHTTFFWSKHASTFHSSKTGQDYYYGYGNGEIRPYGDNISSYQSPHFAVLVRYPIDKIMQYADEYNVDLEHDGIKIYGQYYSTETWESGYTIDRIARGVAELFIVDRTGKGVFTKRHRADTFENNVTQGAQTTLADGTQVDLDNYTWDGFRRYPYYIHYNGTAPTHQVTSTDEQGNQVTSPALVPQRLILEEQQLMLSSAGAKHSRGWQPNGEDAAARPIGTGYEGDGNYFLTDDDYTIPRFDVLTFEDYQGSYSAGVWTEGGLLAYSKYKPLFVYIRYAHTNEYVPYCAVVKTSSTGHTVYKCDPEAVDESGNPVIYKDNNHKIDENGQKHYPLPAGVTGIKYVHDTTEDVFRMDINVTVHVILKPTQAVMDCVNADLNHVNSEGAASPVNTYVKNIASYAVHKGNTDGGWNSEPWLNGDNYANGNGVAESVIWILNRITNSMSVEKSAMVPKDDDPAQQAANLQNMEIGYVKLQARNNAGISKNIVYPTDTEDPYKMLSGTFYELLPKGTNIRADSVFGVYNETWSSHQYGASKYTDWVRYKDRGELINNSITDGHRYFLGTGDYSVSTEYIPELDQTLVRIDYSFADPRINGCPDSTWNCFVAFFFIIENPYANIRARGTSTQNYIAFENTTEGGRSAVAGGSKITAANLNNRADVAALFQEKTADNSRRAGCAKAAMTWNAVTVLEAGYTKTVATPESLNGLPQAENYTSDGGRVTVNNRYIYRLQLTNMPTTRADKIILYDILESGTDAEATQWQGKFVSVDTSLISATPSDKSTTHATCKPVVYYSTNITKKISMTDPDLHQDAMFNLQNGQYWSTICPDDPSTVTAIAIDCTKASDNTDFRLGPKASLTAFIHMKAPEEMVKKANGEIDVDAVALDGSLAAIRPYNETPGDIDENVSWLMSRASVMLRDVNISLVKASDPMTGTPTARTIVDSDGTGTIVYRLRLRNTMPFDCNNVVVTDPIPDDLTIDKITVKLNGNESETDGDSTPGFAYTVAADGRGLTFNIDQQHPTTETSNKDTYIYIYTKVDKLVDADGKQVFLRDYDNTATLVSANEKPIGEPTETMYHRAETVKIDIEKIWDDANDRYKKRPASIKLTLSGTYVSGKNILGQDIVEELKDENGDPVLAQITVTPDEDGYWYGSFDNLSKYKVETEDADFEHPTTWYEIDYKIEEDAIYDPADTSDPPEPIYTAEYGDMTGEGGQYTMTVTNRYNGFTGLEITKMLDGYVDAGTESNVTLAFKVEGFNENETNAAYTTYVGMTFNKNDVDTTGNYTKTILLTGLPTLYTYKVTEVYSGNYKPDEITIQYDATEKIWKAVAKNSHNGYTPGSGVVNKYENGTYVKPGGNAGGGGEPSAGNEGGN